MIESKDTNPKDAIGSGKLPMHLVPDTLTAYASLAFLEGALKYGKFNWRVAGVRASIYLDAVERHLSAYRNGEWADPSTGVPHLASVLACVGIILDADLVGKLTDDRPPRADVKQFIDTQATMVKLLKEKFAGHNPHQHTIADEWDKAHDAESFGDFAGDGWSNNGDTPRPIGYDNSTQPPTPLYTLDDLIKTGAIVDVIASLPERPVPAQPRSYMTKATDDAGA